MCLAIRLEHFGPDHEYTAISYANLAVAQNSLAQYERAEANHRKAIAIWEKKGMRSTDLAETYNNLGMLIMGQGRAAEASDAILEAVAIYDELDLKGSRYANMLNTLGTSLNDAGRFVESERILRESLQMNIDALGDKALQVGANHLSLSRALVGQGKYTEGLDHAQTGYDVFVGVIGESHLFTAAARSYVGDAMWRNGDIAGGRAALTSVIEVQREKLPGSSWRMSQTLFWLAQLDMHVDEPAAAEPLLREAIEFRKMRHNDDSWAVAEVQVVLADCLVRQQRNAEARRTALGRRAQFVAYRRGGGRSHRGNGQELLSQISGRP